MNASPPKQTADAAAPTAGGIQAAPQKRKFHNGWTREIEQLMSRWADFAICYHWMHERTHRLFKSRDMGFMFPVIILSTLTGAANFAMESVLNDDTQKTYAQLALGGLSIATGIISTIANRLGYASSSEAHKGSAALWGKFQRQITVELSLHPNERTECMTFLKICRTELDRLIEQSPTIPTAIINACREEFKNYPKVRKPEIVGDIDTTHVFQDTNSRLKELARDAAMMIQAKKGTLKQIVLDDLEPRINRVLEHSTLPALKDELRKVAERVARETVLRGPPRPAPPPAADVGPLDLQAAAAERAEEVRALSRSGVVKEMRELLSKAQMKLPPQVRTILTPDQIQNVSRLLPIAEESDDEVAAASKPEGVVIHVRDMSESESEGEEEGTGAPAAAAPAAAEEGGVPGEVPTQPANGH